MFSIGQLSKKTGVKIPTIRYYEQMGIIDAPMRSPSNQRRYSIDEVERLSFIAHGRELGLSIKDIGELIELNLHPEKSCDEVHDIANRHLFLVQSRIKKLKSLEKELKRMVGQTDSGHIGQCYVIASLARHDLCKNEH
jgi:DNA-binding transcriptional MerR regulator